MEQHDVLVIEDDSRMPTGQDWLLIEHDDGVLFVVRREAFGSPRWIADAWAGYRALAERRLQGPPTLRAV